MSDECGVHSNQPAGSLSIPPARSFCYLVIFYTRETQREICLLYVCTILSKFIQLAGQLVAGFIHHGNRDFFLEAGYVAPNMSIKYFNCFLNQKVEINNETKNPIGSIWSAWIDKIDRTKPKAVSSRFVLRSALWLHTIKDGQTDSERDGKPTNWITQNFIKKKNTFA